MTTVLRASILSSAAVLLFAACPSKPNTSSTRQGTMSDTCAAIEDCTDLIDNDCDGNIDCNDESCREACSLGCDETENCANEVDNDCDGWIGCDDPDCRMPPEHGGRADCDEPIENPVVQEARHFMCDPNAIAVDTSQVVEETGDQIVIRPTGAPCQYDLVYVRAGVERTLSLRTGGNVLWAATSTPGEGLAICYSDVQHHTDAAITDWFLAESGFNPGERTGQVVDSVDVVCSLRLEDGTWLGPTRVVTGDSRTTGGWAAWVKSIEFYNVFPNILNVTYQRDFSFFPFNDSDEGRPASDGIYIQQVEVGGGLWAEAWHKSSNSVLPLPDPVPPNPFAPDLQGDLDDSGALDAGDIPLFQLAIGDPQAFFDQQGEGPLAAGGDMNGDAIVTQRDLDIAFPGNCAPGQIRCTGDHAGVEMCTTSGRWLTRLACGEDVCVGLAGCTPGGPIQYECKPQADVLATCRPDEAHQCRPADNAGTEGVPADAGGECVPVEHDEDGEPLHFRWVATQLGQP